MKEMLTQIYFRFPSLLKRVLFNLEAVRRNKFRKSGKYTSFVNTLTFNDLIKTSESEILNRMNSLLEYANEHVEHYKGAFNNTTIKAFEDFSKLPLLSKSDVRENADKLISTELPVGESWKGSTSGSTGSPLKYYKDPESVMFNQVIYDKYYEFLGCDNNKKKIRFSGIKIRPFESLNPPFWVYIDLFKQLQCSVYHIKEHTIQHYLRKFRHINANYGTGFPSAWLTMARLMNSQGVKFSGLKAIITDSEGLTEVEKKEIENAFCCSVFRTYGLGEVGMFAVECKNNHYHIINYTHFAEVVDEAGTPVSDGEIGEIVVTDLYSKNCPFIRYKTGDLGIMSHQDCGCGIDTPYFREIVGRVEDYILTKDGRKVTRLSLILKPAVGIKESQIIQVTRDEIVINVIPDRNFEPESMEDVLISAKEFIGDMTISWRTVRELERMPSGKVKFLINKVK